MKIQHWAIIFVLIILPFSIICRNKIQKKMAVLKDETRFNNIIDNATYDAVSQLTEIAEQLEYGKNIPITKSVAEAVADRFFTTMAVNFNLNPIRKIGSMNVDEKDDDYYFGGIITSTDESVKDYFHSSSQEYLSQFVPAVIIVGYDRFFTFAYSPGNGYGLVKEEGTKYNNNYTLDNFITISPVSPTGSFKKLYEDDPNETHELKGYVGNFLDYDGDGVDDWDPTGSGTRVYTNPYNIGNNGIPTVEFLMNYLPSYTDNLSYIIFEVYTRLGIWGDLYELYCDPDGTGGTAPDFTKVNHDYIYDLNGKVIPDSDKYKVSQFHIDRRKTIIKQIREELDRAFNNQNQYANTMGVTYKFYLPEISMDQWNHTIDDISVLSFVQGLPMGYDGFYNSYSLGGARIVLARNYYAETVEDERGLTGSHKVYHRWFCKCLPRNRDGTIAYQDNAGAYGVTTKEYTTDPSELDKQGYPHEKRKNTSYIIQEFITVEDARAAGYYACSLCM